MANKILIVIDYQKDFVKRINGAENIDSVIANLIKKRKEEGWTIIYTMDTHSPGSYPHTAEGKLLPIHAEYLTDGWKLYGETGKLLEDADMNAFRVLKDTMGYTEWWDFITDTELIDYMGLNSATQIDEVELCGLDFPYCVFQNALTFRNMLPRAKVSVNFRASETSDVEMAIYAKRYLEKVGVEVEWFKW